MAHDSNLSTNYVTKCTYIILVNFGRSAANNLNHIFSNSDNNNEDMSVLTHSPHMDTLRLNDALASTKDNFAVFSLNIQSINAKFNYLSPLLLDLCNKGTGFSTICLQESWLSEDSDLSQYHIPNYNIIHQGHNCSGHAGLIIYLHERYQYNIRNLCEISAVWEGLFLDIHDANL